MGTVMRRWTWSTIFLVASVFGGLFLTLLSGLNAVKPFIVDAEIVYFGFPLPWLKAIRSTWLPKPPLTWSYFFFWQQFIVDFIVYGILAFASVYLYFRLNK